MSQPSLRGLNAQHSLTAQRSRYVLRELQTIEEMVAASELLDEVWHERGGTVMPANLIRAISHAGGYVSGAYDGDRLIAASLGFLGFHHDALALHSHITGAAPGHQSGGIGFALKQHQRTWCLERGIATITWTFDPLVSRNAYFNLHKLGAIASDYGADFYGDMRDGVNAGDRSDRLVVTWELTSQRAIAAAAGNPLRSDGDNGLTLLDADAAGRPRVVDSPLGDASTLRCRVPMDVLSLRRHDPPAALEWRLAVRATLGQAVTNGYIAVDATSDGWYVLTREVRP